MRVLGYARVSSIGQADGTSLQDQQSAIQAYAKARGVAPGQIFFFVEAESAVREKIEHRAEMRRLLAGVRRGDLVLCDKLDRWSRDPEFTYKSVREILAAGANFYAVGDACDPSTPEGDTMLGFRILFAREEHKRIKQRLVGTRRLLRDKGYYVEGRTPLGYVRPTSADRLGHNVLAVDPKWAAVVEELFRRAPDESISELLKWAEHAHPERTWDKKLIGNVLRSRVYLGEALDTRGVWIPGPHKALIAPAVFAKAQAALDARKLGGARLSGESRTKTWLLREIGTCAKCGAKISAAYGAGQGPPGPGRKYAHYYRCPRKCPGYTPVVDADAAVVAAVLGRLTEIRELFARPAKARPASPVVDYAARKAKLAAKRGRYLELFADGALSREELALALGKVDAERTKLEASEAVREPVARDRREVLAELGNVAKAWRKSTPEEQRRVLKWLAIRVRIARGRPPAVDWRDVTDL